MCGIIGVVNGLPDEAAASRMCEALRHRGPDSGGEWREKDVWFAQRRLAILDLSPQGHQPMHSPCGRYVLTFNGEIYNYRELRHNLEHGAWHFRGESDTEVVLAACAVWGVERAAALFEGMFAFGLYDRTDRVLWLARDPMGIKPLYYAQRGARFAFSSELTALLHLPWIEREIDPDALFAYFRYSCVPAPVSILKGVRKLRSGSILRLSDGAPDIRPFWRLEAQVAKRESIHGGRATDLTEAAEELEAHLRRSVRLHMQADVPYGAFLSGGIDSSAVVALMQAESSRPVKTFAIGFSEKSHDEAVYARAVARALGTDHRELILDSDQVPELVPEVASHFDEPFADNSAIPTYLLSRFAKESVAVCLSGDGGDELFGGYPRYFWAARIERLRRRLSPGGARLAAKLLERTPAGLWDHVVNPVLGYRYSGAEGLAYRVKRFASYLGGDRASAYARSMSVWAEPADLLGYRPIHPLGADAERHMDLPWAEEMMLIDQRNYLQDDILTKLDRASMAVSLEARVPMLAHPVVEFSWRLDSKLKLAERGDRGKLVLRELLYKHVPRELVDRPKQGFGMPIARWLRGPLRDWAESLFTGAELEACGLRAETVSRIWREHLAGSDRQAMLWTVLMYRQWHQRVNGC